MTNWIPPCLGDSDLYSWVILPLLIFVARVFDVTLGTLRIIFVSRGNRRLAPLLGFAEVLIWIVVIGQLVQNLHSITAYLGYAAGFAVGSFIGMVIEDRLAIGVLVIRVILPKGGEDLANQLRTAGYGVTAITGEGAQGPVKLIFTIAQRKDLPHVTDICHRLNPKAFISVDEIRSARHGTFPPRSQETFMFLRKSK